MDLLALLIPWWLGTTSPPATTSSAVRLYQPQLRIRVLLQIPVPERAVRVACEEATRIWAPHMRLTFDDPTVVADQSGPAPDLTALISNKPVSTRLPADTAWETDLAAIGFYNPNTPSTLIQVFYPGVVRLAMNASLSGSPVSRWPPRLAEDAVARVLGRVLAHEVGHFVLRSSHHSPTGLMRGTHMSAEFVGFAGGGFRLAPVDITRFRTLFSEWGGVAAAR